MEKAKKTVSAPKVSSAPKPKTASASGKAPRSHGVGRRKSAIARVWLRRGNGDLSVNGLNYKEYFETDMNRMDASIPMHLVPSATKYDVEVNVRGGGLCAQAGAVKLGIARALVAIESDLRVLLRKHDLLTVDSRRKERKKYGQKGARRKFQFVKR